MLGGLSAQSGGTVKYEFTQHVEPPEDRPQRKARKRVMQYDLTFTKEQSIYEKDTEFEDPNADERSRRWWRQNKPHVIYYDHKEEKTVEQVNFFKKDFLLSDTIETLQWKIVASEQRDILGYTAMRAILKDTSRMVDAWFTPQLTYSVGPSDFYGLPGLILAVAVDEEKVMLAKSITLSEETPSIDIPKKGKKMNRTDYEKMREEKTAEMKKNWKNSSRRWRK